MLLCSGNLDKYDYASVFICGQHSPPNATLFLLYEGRASVATATRHHRHNGNTPGSFGVCR
jgi:hypothetical protein